MPKARLLVIGLGQEIRGDDAVGLETVRLWQAEYPETARRTDLVVESAPLPGLSLLSFLECAEAAILVDAMQSGAPAGTVRVLERDDLAGFGGDAQSAHGWGVAETLAMAETLYKEKMPQRLVLLAVEAGNMDLGKPMSTMVKAALPSVAKQLQALVLDILAAEVQPPADAQLKPWPQPVSQ
ncbi:MAG: hydrogenase maturation protease [Anaerolineales bacterium]